jgi:hypothetical protein
MQSLQTWPGTSPTFAPASLTGPVTSPPLAHSTSSACERLAEALTSNALSKLRHLSRAQIVKQWLRWLEKRTDDETAHDDPGEREDGN